MLETLDITIRPSHLRFDLVTLCEGGLASLLSETAPIACSVLDLAFTAKENKPIR